MELILAVMAVVIFYLIIQGENRSNYKKYKTVGDVGESIVAKRLLQLGSEFEDSNNVYIGNAQIDHIAINRDKKIIFVIETKLWGGVITGRHDEKFWQQDKNGVLKYFPNPILQNRFHCREVKRKYKGYMVINVVVFIRNENVPPYKCIVRVNDLVSYINNTSNKVCNMDRIGM
jgi:hypothetical protein